MEPTSGFYSNDISYDVNGPTPDVPYSDAHTGEGDYPDMDGCTCPGAAPTDDSVTSGVDRVVPVY